METIPIYLLTGFLGAGKTTTLNHLLTLDFFKKRELVVIINEFGTIGIDGPRVNRSETRHKLFEINRGSLFCTCTEKDFLKILLEMKEKIRPDAIIIEASGIAETGDINRLIIDSGLSDFFEIHCNICVVDATNFIKLLPMVKSVRSQVVFADSVVINKCDLIDEKELKVLKKVIQSINPKIPIDNTVKGNINSMLINSISHNIKEKAFIDKPPENIYSITIRNSIEIDRNTFANAILEIGKNLLRLKGNIKFSTGTKFVEVINGELVNEEQISEQKNTSFVAIGWKINKAKMKEIFDRMVWCNN